VPRAVLSFCLAGTPGLNKARLGEWLGEPSEDKTLASFAFAFSFADQPLEQALRVFCSKVKLPESSKKTDRLL
jgi:Sec7-like guanine-nucleotide exchange factor